MNYRWPFAFDMYFELGGDFSDRDSTGGGANGAIAAMEDYLVANFWIGWALPVTSVAAGMPRTVGVTVDYSY